MKFTLIILDVMKCCKLKIQFLHTPITLSLVLLSSTPLVRITKIMIQNSNNNTKARLILRPSI